MGATELLHQPWEGAGLRRRLSEQTHPHLILSPKSWVSGEDRVGGERLDVCPMNGCHFQNKQTRGKSLLHLHPPPTPSDPPGVRAHCARFAVSTTRQYDMESPLIFEVKLTGQG